MRIRSIQQPPTKEDFDRIVQQGASSKDEQRLGYFLRRLRQAFFVDAQNRPLQPRARLVEQYKSDGLVLFLGAGVSMSSGIPSWPKLADAILEKSGVTSSELEIVKKALPSYMVRFELAAQRLGRKEFATAIYEELYHNVKYKSLLEKIPFKYEASSSWRGWRRVLKALQTNKTLEAVGDLLITSDGPTARRNPQIPRF